MLNKKELHRHMVWESSTSYITGGRIENGVAIVPTSELLALAENHTADLQSEIRCLMRRAGHDPKETSAFVDGLFEGIKTQLKRSREQYNHGVMT